MDKSTEPESVVAPQVVPVYMDPEDAIERCAGKSALYTLLLEKFLVQYSKNDTEIATALSEGRRHDAISLAHSICGVAGNLSLPALRSAVIRREQLLRDARVSLEDLKCDGVTYRETLLATLQAVDAYLKTAAVKS
jgi:HPt (histidine-containing phosphotransfer) domain-containing protein